MKSTNVVSRGEAVVQQALDCSQLNPEQALEILTLLTQGKSYNGFVLARAGKKRQSKVNKDIRPRQEIVDFVKANEPIINEIMDIGYWDITTYNQAKRVYLGIVLSVFKQKNIAFVANKNEIRMSNKAFAELFGPSRTELSEKESLYVKYGTRKMREQTLQSFASTQKKALILLNKLNDIEERLKIF